jgi:hypothetical protein
MKHFLPSLLFEKKKYTRPLVIRIIKKMGDGEIFEENGIWMMEICGRNFVEVYA